MGNSGLESIGAVPFIKPHCEFGISDSGTAEVIELCYLFAVCNEMGDGVGGDSCSQTVSSNAEWVESYTMRE